MSEATKATVSAAAILAVNILALFGISLDTDTIVNGVCAVAMIAATLYGCWKNHNWTQAAQLGQQVVDAQKALMEVESVYHDKRKEDADKATGDSAEDVEEEVL